jgi:hypothetical protein
MNGEVDDSQNLKASIGWFVGLRRMVSAFGEHGQILAGSFCFAV